MFNKIMQPIIILIALGWLMAALFSEASYVDKSMAFCLFYIMVTLMECRS